MNAQHPLAGLEQDLIRLLGDPQFLYAICWERETGSADPHPYRQALGFDYSSNRDGAAPRTRGSDGVDRITGWRSARRLKARYFEQAARGIRNRTYQPAPLRQVDVPKKDADGNIRGYRTLGIPTYIDRIVIEGLRQLLEPRLDRILPAGFRGYRASSVAGEPVSDPKLEGYARGSTKSIALAIKKGAYSGFPFITEMDVVGAYDHVSRGKLKKLLINHGATPWVATLIIRCAGTDVTDKKNEKETFPIKGIAQGSPVSPLLWNLYAMFLYLDSSEGLLTHGYADNIWYQTRTERDLDLVRERIDRQLGERGLRGMWSKSVDLRGESLVVLKEWELSPLDGRRWELAEVASPAGGSTRTGLVVEVSPMGRCRHAGESVEPSEAASLPNGIDVEDEDHDRTADRGETCPSRFRTGKGMGTSHPSLPNPCYRAGGGTTQDRGPASSDNRRGGAGAVPITSWLYTSKQELTALVDELLRDASGLDPVLRFPCWAQVESALMAGHSAEAVFRRWWQMLSAILIRRRVRQLAVVVPMADDVYHRIPGVLGTPFASMVAAMLDLEEIAGRNRLGDAHWIRRGEYVAGDYVMVVLRRRTPCRKLPGVRRPGTHVVVWSHQVSRSVDAVRVREHRAVAVGLTHGLVASGRAATLYGPYEATAASPVTAQAAALTQLLRPLAPSTVATIYSNQNLVLRAARVGEPLQGRPGEMRSVLAALRRACGRLEVRARRSRTAGRLHAEMLERWLAGRATTGTEDL